MAGYPMPTIRWLKDEKEFTADGDRIKPFVQEDGTFGLIFATTVAADKGIYTAIAESEEGFARYAFEIRGHTLITLARFVYFLPTTYVPLLACLLYRVYLLGQIKKNK